MYICFPATPVHFPPACMHPSHFSSHGSEAVFSPVSPQNWHLCKDAVWEIRWRTEHRWPSLWLHWQTAQQMAHSAVSKDCCPENPKQLCYAVCWSQLDYKIKYEMQNCRILLPRTPVRSCFRNTVLNNFFHSYFDILLWCLDMMFSCHGTAGPFSGLPWEGLIPNKDVSVDDKLFLSGCVLCSQD